jgi:hypothetical protein
MHMLVLNLLEVKSFEKIYSVKSHLYYSSLNLRYFKVSFRLPWEKKQWKKYLLSKLDHHANFKSNWNICTTPNLVLKIDCICYSKQQNILNLFYAYKLFKAMPIFKVTMSCLIHNWSNLDNKYFFHCFFSHGNLKLTLKYRKFNYYNINDFLRYKFFQMISILVNLVQSVSIATNVVSLNLAHGKVYLMQHYVINSVSDLLQVCGFLRVFLFPPPVKLTATI